jgi:hypothetical protein
MGDPLQGNALTNRKPPIKSALGNGLPFMARTPSALAFCIGKGITGRLRAGF